MSSGKKILEGSLLSAIVALCGVGIYTTQTQPSLPDAQEVITADIPLADSTGKQQVPVFANEYVIVTQGDWCPLAIEDGLVKKPKNYDPDTFLPAGVYLLDINGKRVAERGEVIYQDVELAMRDCSDLFGLPEGSTCQQNIPITKLQQDPRSVYQWSAKAYPHLFKRPTPTNVQVAVFDTGVSPHPDLNLAESVSFVTGEAPLDGDGHGTHVAGTCCAINNNGVGVVSPGNGAEVVSVKVLGNNGSGSLYSIARGVDWLLGYKKTVKKKLVANFSLGALGAKSLCKSMKKLKDAGIVTVVAAGNEGKNLKNHLTYPAACPVDDVIVVGSLDANGERSWFSNRGNAVDIYAPGGNILSTSNNKSYVAMSGTSMASPFVAGVAATVLSQGNRAKAHMDKRLTTLIERR